MSKPSVLTIASRIRAIHTYEVIASGNSITADIAGRKFHFIGAGGIGMSGLARLLLKHKATVTGSDQMRSEVIDRLNRHGANIKAGHDSSNLEDATDAVVISAAIKEDNPELTLARQCGLRVFKYAEMLGRLFNCYNGIAVAGTHGKSTTSGWLAHCLKQAGLDPNFIVGAEIPQLGGNSGEGNGRHFVAEACEYDRSFLNLKPQIGCILNIEQDHLDYYRDEAEIVEAFCDFARGIKKGGVLIANGEDANVTKVIAAVPASVRCRTFGFGSHCNFRADNIDDSIGLCRFDVYEDGRQLGQVRINLPGRHNVANALAVVAVLVNAGFKASEALELLPGFTGVDRRLMLKAQAGGVAVLDDYAHHPTEIRASLAAIRQRYQPRRLWCVFQPHQYSRTRFLLDDFAESFKLADVTIVPEIYFVRDSLANKKEVNSQILVEKIRGAGSEALFIDGFERICDHLKKEVGRGDVVVTMGAGDVWKIADEYIQWLRANSQDRSPAGQ